jgi:hypothetical protein
VSCFFVFVVVVVVRAHVLGPGPTSAHDMACYGVARTGKQKRTSASTSRSKKEPSLQTMWAG